MWHLLQKKRVKPDAFAERWRSLSIHGLCATSRAVPFFSAFSALLRFAFQRAGEKLRKLCIYFLSLSDERFHAHYLCVQHVSLLRLAKAKWRVSGTIPR